MPAQDDRQASIQPRFSSPAHAVAPQHLQQLLAQRRRLCMAAHWLMQCRNEARRHARLLCVTMCPVHTTCMPSISSKLMGLQPEGACWRDVGSHTVRTNKVGVPMCALR